MSNNCVIDSPAYKKIIKFIAIGMGIFQLIVAGYGFLVTNMRGSIHLTFAMVLVAMYKPVRFKNAKLTDVYNILFVLVALFCGMFLTFQTRASYALIYTLNGPSQIDVIVGMLIIVMILICSRRTTGWALPLICTVFLLYGLFGHYLPGFLNHKEYTLRNIVDVVVYTSEGLLGQPLSISSSYVASFVMFGAFLASTGAGQWFIDMAFALTGRSRSGPAMAAVVSSAALGTISGTGVANVVTTGAFTIPLMKSCGYSAKMAGAIEATASTGGQIMPPIMGAGAFILAEMIGVPYGTIALAATLPALLYFLAVAFQVDFEAGRLGMKGLPASQLPPKYKTFKTGWFFLMPVAMIVWSLVIMNFSANYSALMAIGMVLLVGYFFKSKKTRLNFSNVFQALEGGSKDLISVAMACAVAGLMIGVLTKTGLGLKFASLLILAAGGEILPTLVLTMVCCIFLGMGLPTTAAFIITATLCAPALITLGIPQLAAYMFVFYFACLSAITPPVALAAFAAAAISGSRPMETGLKATRIGLAGFVIPYFFCFTPALLLQGSLTEIVQVAVTSIIGIFFLSGGLGGYMWKSLNVIERLALIIAALLMVEGGNLTDIIGIVIGGSVILLQVKGIKKKNLLDIQKTAIS
ncbi:MAG: TRAP transporter permease [Eubacteriales bacterium]|nr:TRAP transporter permease [Eubacteriales bacterium]